MVNLTSTSDFLSGVTGLLTKVQPLDIPIGGSVDNFFLIAFGGGIISKTNKKSHYFALLRDKLANYEMTGGQLLSFNALKILFHYLLDARVAEEAFCVFPVLTPS